MSGQSIMLHSVMTMWIAELLLCTNKKGNLDVMKRNRGKLAVARSRTQDTSGLSRHAVFCHWAMTTRQLPTLTILYMYCTGGTECFSRTPSSHSAGAIRTLLGVDRKFLSPPGKNPCWVVFSLQMLRASGLRISKFALLSAWGKMLWTLYNDVDGSSAKMPSQKWNTF